MLHRILNSMVRWPPFLRLNVRIPAHKTHGLSGESFNRNLGRCAQPCKVHDFDVAYRAALSHDVMQTRMVDHHDHLQNQEYDKACPNHSRKPPTHKKSATNTFRLNTNQRILFANGKADVTNPIRILKERVQRIWKTFHSQNQANLYVRRHMTI